MELLLDGRDWSKTQNYQLEPDNAPLKGKVSLQTANFGVPCWLTGGARCFFLRLFFQVLRPVIFGPLVYRFSVQKVGFAQISGDSWMYPGPNVPSHEKSRKVSPIARGYFWVSYPQESLENTINTMGTRT